MQLYRPFLGAHFERPSGKKCNGAPLVPLPSPMHLRKDPRQKH